MITTTPPTVPSQVKRCAATLPFSRVPTGLSMGAVATAISPRAYAWTETLEDLSGMEPSDDDWLDLDDPPESLHGLLFEVGRVYAPFMLGNAAAVASGAARVECRVDGQPWLQEPFVYQAKCLRWLRERYAALSNPARERVDRVLAGTGCETLVAKA